MPTVTQSADWLKRNTLCVSRMSALLAPGVGVASPGARVSVRCRYRGGNCEFGAGAARFAVGAFAV